MIFLNDVMKIKIKLDLLNWWIQHPEEIGTVPSALKHRISKEDAIFIVNEIEITDGRMLKQSDILRYRNIIKNEIDKERELKLQEKIVDIQKKSIDIQDNGLGIHKSTRKSQWAIAIIMFFSMLFAAGSTYFSWQGHLIVSESMKAKFIPRITCSQFPDNEIVSVEVTIYNSGGVGDYITGQYFVENVYLALGNEYSVDGKEKELKFRNISRFVISGGVWNPPVFNLNISDVNVSSFKIGYKIECLDKNPNCILVEGKVECKYSKKLDGSYVKDVKCV